MEVTFMCNNFGDRILELLKKRNLMQKELSQLVGVTEATMSRYVRGERTPKAEVVANIATALHTTSDYLLGTEKEGNIDNDFPKIQRLIARNANSMTDEQKRELINALFKSNER